MICPGEEFLPRAPDPEDILIECQNNPGDEGEGGKIENDVGTPTEDNPGENCAEEKPEENSTGAENETSEKVEESGKDSVEIE